MSQHLQPLFFRRAHTQAGSISTCISASGKTPYTSYFSASTCLNSPEMKTFHHICSLNKHALSTTPLYCSLLTHLGAYDFLNMLVYTLCDLWMQTVRLLTGEEVVSRWHKADNDIIIIFFLFSPLKTNILLLLSNVHCLTLKLSWNEKWLFNSFRSHSRVPKKTILLEFLDQDWPTSNQVFFVCLLTTAWQVKPCLCPR